MKTRHIYILTIISIFTIFSCTKEKSEGPSINELYGDFDGTASLLVSNKNPNFSNNEVTKFSCEFGKIVDWKISITGLVSNAKKIITGNSNILDSNINFWDGSASEFPFFIEENCALELTFLYQPDTLRDTVLITGTQLYDDGYIVADFENGFPVDGYIKPQINPDQTFVIADDQPLLGDYYFQMGGKINFDWALGKIDLKLDYSSSPISASAEDFYLNLGILSDTVGLHTGQFMNILISESDSAFNSGGAADVATIFDNNEEVYKLKIYIDWDGWKLISIRYSDFVATNSSPGVTFAKNPKDIKGMRIACQACPSSGASAQCEENFDRMVRTDFDHIIFTENRAFFDVITGFVGDTWNKN